MSLDKAIKHGKEKRKPYRGSKAIDYTCRNHGSCEWCKRNRMHKFRDKNPIEEEEQTMITKDELDTIMLRRIDDIIRNEIPQDRLKEIEKNLENKVMNGEITEEEADEQYYKAYWEEYCNAHHFI